jgi:hypothetical protein
MPRTKSTEPADDQADTVQDDPSSDSIPSDEPTTGSNAPAGYVWVSRKREGVTLGTLNPTWSTPTLIDAKSFPELEAQGYVIVTAPEDDK